MVKQAAIFETSLSASPILRQSTVLPPFCAINSAPIMSVIISYDFMANPPFFPFIILCSAAVVNKCVFLFFFFKENGSYHFTTQKFILDF